MAGIFQQFLQGVTNGFLDSKNLKDYTHASKTFVSNQYQNAPKFKWLFHVYFDINYDQISDTNLQAALPPTTNLGLMVKSVELPKFNMPLTELNQYNRKRYVQTKIQYQPIRISFHDDNGDQIRKMWSAYYNYNYYDGSNPNTSYGRNTADPSVAVTTLNDARRNVFAEEIPESVRNWGLNGDYPANRKKYPFFKSIRIYGFNQHNYSEYVLINPVIESFEHDTYNYSETNSTMEHTMSIKYETVKYYNGALNGQKPGDIVKGFADPSVYDTELSPIARLGSNRSIMGQGGLVDSVDGIINDLSKGNVLGAIQTAGRVSRTFKNSQQILQAAKTEVVAGAVDAISNSSLARTPFNFPSLGSTQRQSPAPVEDRTPEPIIRNT